MGLFLGLTIGAAFVTGLISHVHQNPVAWLPLPPEPAWGYQLTQGVHVAAGLAALPLLLAKLYAAYPALFEQPPVRGLLHALERASVAVLVATATFQLISGVLNTFQWYPWSFGFVRVHFAASWVLVGSMLVHVAVKLPTIVAALRRGRGVAPDGEPRGGGAGGLPDAAPDSSAEATRRGFLAATAVTVLGLTALTVGQTVRPLAPLAVLAPRQSGVGPQGVPVNKTARSAGVEQAALDPAWRLTLVGPRRSTTLSRDELAAMSTVEARLPIACVEGWSTTATWEGVRLADLVAMVHSTADVDVRVVSLQERGAFRQSVLPAGHVMHPDTLLALRLNGEELDLDHGFPARLIAPHRPGVLQTKWVGRIEVL